jgi:hypothetical protein
MKTLILSLLVLCLCLGSTCFGVDLPREERTAQGITFHLPAGWKPIPKDVLDAYCEAVAKMAPNAAKQSYDYGFQLAESAKWFDYPYILVQVNRSGRISESQFESMKKVEQDMARGMEKTRDAMSSFASGARLGEPVYDPASHILWTRIVLDVKGAGMVRGVVGVVLTERGFIQVSGYAREMDFPSYAPVFEAIIRNIALGDELKYRSLSGESLKPMDWGKVLRNGLIGAAIAGVLALILTLVGKRKSGS